MLDYDPDTGIFTWKVRPCNSVQVGNVAGRVVGNGYISIQIDKVSYGAHRLAWLYVHGAWPDDQIDHINTVKTDNRIVNLRPATGGQNMQNRHRALRGSTSQYLGVSWRNQRSKWVAQISVDGRGKTLGYFNTEEEARDAYLAAKAVLHPYSTLET